MESNFEVHWTTERQASYYIHTSSLMCNLMIKTIGSGIPMESAIVVVATKSFESMSLMDLRIIILYFPLISLLPY